jgi:ATP-binding protein involved in chromosome partitioning
MVTEEQVRQALRKVNDPEIGKPIEDLGMLQAVRIDDGTVTVQILLTVAGCPLKDRIDSDVRAALAPLEGIRHVQVLLGEMTGDQREQMVSSWPSRRARAVSGSPPSQ